jgi:hypothetical protein
MVELPEMEACTLVETAWCSTTDRCAPSETACVMQKDTAVLGECEELR